MPSRTHADSSDSTAFRGSTGSDPRSSQKSPAVGWESVGWHRRLGVGWAAQAVGSQLDGAWCTHHRQLSQQAQRCEAQSGQLPTQDMVRESSVTSIKYFDEAHTDPPRNRMPAFLATASSLTFLSTVRHTASVFSATCRSLNTTHVRVPHAG